MTTIYLIRHAEAEGNLYRIAHGHYNSCITDDRGCRQIRALAERFRDVPVDAVYASDLIRTRTTAQSIYLPKGLQLHPDPAFREICMGEWEEHCWYELLRKYPQSCALSSEKHKKTDKFWRRAACGPPPCDTLSSSSRQRSPAPNPLRYPSAAWLCLQRFFSSSAGE